MLRHLHPTELAIALVGAGIVLACNAVACNAADPVEVGVDFVTPRLSRSDPPLEPEVPPLEDDGSEPVVGRMEPILDFDEFIDQSVERGEVSEYCRSSFQACGGLLAGTWVVEDNCNPQTSARDVLQSWGRTRMSLDENACWDAVQLMRWNWSGELEFVNGIAYDKRERRQQVDMQLDSRCLNATFNLNESEGVSPRLCQVMEDDWTTCGVAEGVCLCSTRTVSAGAASGVYGVLGLSVAIDANPTTYYEYCVDGDVLLWREKDGAQRHVVLRRTVDPPPGAVDPVEPPR